MLGWNRFLAKISNMLRPNKAEQDLNREIESHIALIEDDFHAQGMTPEKARVAAVRAYGNVAQVKESHREERSFVWVGQVMQDVRYAFRTFFKNKLFTGVALLTLALGIGANAGIFSIINTVLLHPLAYPDTNRLVAITGNNPKSQITIVSYTKLIYLQPQVKTLEGVAAYYPLALNVTAKGAPEQVPAAHASVEMFRLLGVSPAFGRGFLPEEDRLGGRDVALISNAFWQRHLGADPHAVGSVISIDGRDTTILGVLPADFHFPFTHPEPQVWLPRVFENPNYSPERVRGGVAYLVLIGKVRVGQTLEAARTELDTIGNSYKQAYPNFPDATTPLAVATLENSLVANVRPSLIALLAAVGFVLLIACVNVANLLLARAVSRARETAIRRALGATKGRLIRQLLTESLALSFLGGGLGITVAALGLPPMMRLMAPGTIPLSDLVHLDRTVLLFSFGLCCVTGVIFGLVPAVQASNQDVNERLKEGGRGSTTGGGRSRQIMVVLEVALTLMLMTGGGLLIKSVFNLMNVSPGFAPQDVTTFSVSLPPTQYPKPAQRSNFYRQLVERVRALPGVGSVAVVSHLPLIGFWRFVYVCPQGTACQGVGKDPLAAWRQVSPDFLNTMRIPLLHGRTFDERDRADSPPVIIINKAIADRYFTGVNPIGRQIAFSRDMSTMEIVGVVPNLKFIALNAPDSEEMYVPYTQNPWPWMTLVVRSSASLPPPVSSVRLIVSQMDPDLPLSQIQGLDQIVSGSIAQPRLIAGLVGAFAISAMFLAAVGIYGVMAYLVTQRSAEIAIRMALGAQRWNVFQLMVSQGMKLVFIGVVLGLALSLAMTRLLSTLLFGTSPTDFITLAGASLLFAMVAFGACYVPSRRAMRLDALAALRCT
jgi:putative ABC transport system permease protein